METAPFFADVADAPDGARAVWSKTADGVRLRTVAWQGGIRGTVFIFPGRTEYAEKYGRVVRKLVERDYSVLVIDWRGQGLSDRYSKAPRLGHVDDFRNYQFDVNAALEVAAELGLPRPYYMIAHSMGGCIGMRTLLEREDFSAAVMSAPMWRLHMHAVTRELTGRFTGLADRLGFGGRRTPGTNALPTQLAVNFDGNGLTSDREMFAWAAGQISKYPDLSIGGPSIRWTYAALAEMADISRAALPQLPMLVYVGDGEQIVSSRMIQTQVAKMPLGRLVNVEKARHEIFLESADIQSMVWNQIDTFVDGVEGHALVQKTQVS